MSKVYVEKLSAFITKATSKMPGKINLECKHLFSGAALYADDRICITLTPVGLAIKLPETTREMLISNHKALPLQYFPKSPIKKGYALFPGGIASGGTTLHKYVKESIEYVLTIPLPHNKQK